jgi:hypothetical protein
MNRKVTVSASVRRRISPQAQEKYGSKPVLEKRFHGEKSRAGADEENAKPGRKHNVDTYHER